MDVGLTFGQAVAVVVATAGLAVLGRAAPLRVAAPIAIAVMALLAAVIGSWTGSIVVVAALGLALLVGSVIRSNVETREQHAALEASLTATTTDATWENPDGLTPREVDVLGLIAAGRNNEEIAGELHISMATVKTHVNHIFTKTAVRDRAQAVAYAFERGLAHRDGSTGSPPQG